MTTPHAPDVSAAYFQPDIGIRAGISTCLSLADACADVAAYAHEQTNTMANPVTLGMTGIAAMWYTVAGMTRSATAKLNLPY